MNISELSTATVKLSENLNPDLWDRREHLHESVKDQLMSLADQFALDLGINNVDDVLLTGSNAGFAYSPDSTIVLAIQAPIDDNEVYQELLKDKINQWKQENQCTCQDYPVDLALVDSSKPCECSAYSLNESCWRVVPRRRAALAEDFSVIALRDNWANRIQSHQLAGWDRVQKAAVPGSAEEIVVAQLNESYQAALKQTIKPKTVQSKEPVIYGYKTLTEYSSLPNENSLGQPIAQTEEGLKNFWRWFKGSKMVDKQGRPRVFYHGTKYDFDTFNTENGAFFTEVTDLANIYTGNANLYSPNVMPVYLKLVNPVVTWGDDFMEQLGLAHSEEGDDDYASYNPDSEEALSDSIYTAKRHGHDGYIINNVKDWGGLQDQFIVFYPNQIKSATGNRGSFDKFNTKITYEDATLTPDGVNPTTCMFLNEIGFSDEVSEIDNDKEIIDNSSVVGSISKKDVYMFDNGQIQIYFFTDDMHSIKAWVMLSGNKLMAMRSYSKGLIYALIHYLTDIKHIRLMIDASDTLTQKGLNWIINQLSRSGGFNITDENNRPIDANTLKKEWESAKRNVGHGPTTIYIGESKIANNIRLFESSPVYNDRFGVHKSKEQYFEDATLTPDGVNPTTCMFLNEKDVPSKADVIKEFTRFVIKELKIQTPPRMRLKKDPTWSARNKTFGRYTPETNEMELSLAGRNVMDICRTLAHELVHCRQNEQGNINAQSGEDGSQQENEANSLAGIIMRRWGKMHPEFFEPESVTESASGYIPTKAQAKDPRYVMALTKDVRPGEIGRCANKLALSTDKQGKPQTLRADGKFERKLAEALRLFKLNESAEVVDEVKMSPGALQKWASSEASSGMLMGIEFELYVPGAASDDGDYDGDPDYDADEQVYDIDDIARFFESTELAREVTNRLNSEYNEWLDDAISDAVEQAFDEDELIDRIRDEFPVEDFYDEAKSQLEDEEENEEVDDSEIEKRAEELKEDAVYQCIRMQDRTYWSVREEYEDELRGDADVSENDWLRDIGVRYASDAEREFGLSWPYYQRGGSDEPDVDAVADSLQSALGVPVKASTSYHSLTRDATNWLVEPDSSLDSPNDFEDAGVEIVSPPMPVNTMLSEMNRLWQWAKDTGCYTNRTTGLHMNISVPDFSVDRLDYIKLALFMGDQYILVEFNRIANNYCKAATSVIKQRATDEKVQEVLALMRTKLNTDVSKIIHAGFTDKYTSINTHAGYVEFRGPGGDWLSKSPEQLSATALRLAQALSIACDENAYKNEYAKKFYKLVAPSDSNNDTVKLFAKYTAGELSQAELKSTVKQIQSERSKPPMQSWRVISSFLGPIGYTDARTEQDAINAISQRTGTPISQLRAEPTNTQAPAPQQSPSSVAPPTMGGNQRWRITNNANGNSTVRWGRSGEEGRRELEDWARSVGVGNFTVEPVEEVTESRDEYLWQARVKVKQGKYDGYIPVTVSAPDMRRARTLISSMYGVKDSAIGSTTKLPRK